MNATEWKYIVPGVLKGQRVGPNYEYQMRPGGVSAPHTNGNGTMTSDVAAASQVFVFYLSQIRTVRDSLICEMTVKLKTGDLIFHTDLWLGNGRAKEAIAARLGRILAGDLHLDWTPYIEAITYATQEDYRKGEPFVDLWKVPYTADLQYLMYPILPDAETTIIYGNGETAKSLTAMFLGVAVAMGCNLPGMEFRGAPVPVMYLDYETNSGYGSRRLHAVAAGMGIELQEKLFCYRRMERTLTADAVVIAEEMDRRRTGLVIVDSVGMAVGGEINNAEAAMQLFAAFRMMGNRSKLGISHLSAGERDETNTTKPIGSTYFRNLARCTWQSVKAQDDKKGQVSILLKETKVNEDGKHPGIGLRFNFGQGMVQISGVDAAGVPELAQNLPWSARLKASITAGNKTADDISQDIGEPIERVRVELARRNGQSGIVCVESGQRGKPAVWDVKEPEEEIPF